MLLRPLSADSYIVAFCVIFYSETPVQIAFAFAPGFCYLNDDAGLNLSLFASFFSLIILLCTDMCKNWIKNYKKGG